MMLMSLLLVLSLERLISKTPSWHIEKYASQYRDFLQKKGWLGEKASSAALYFYLLVPALLLGAIEYWLLGAFLTFIEQSIVLFICIGCPVLRGIYKNFLNAAQRGDLQACSMYTDQLGHCASQSDSDGSASAEGKSFGQHLTWLNYQHYAAVMLWFIAFGAPGALFYSISRSTTEALCGANHPLKGAAGRLMFALDYIPVRVTVFGMLMMGHFSRALPEWLSHALQFDVPAYDVLTHISAKAEVLTPEEHQMQAENAAIEPRVLVKLAKRNVIFLLVITSALTLVGSLA
ncbi:beta-lactamase regulator AmpE [Alteromonas mediterranea]|uniref:beta-lactamase regulator AmpE n=1 Tax=Alteromonas mediterranea TaxID=314275 RepID=UPI00035574A4|nr:beta-lactamase regulator AmpE [Alteromonas mediterranea]AGP86645.1 regulatory protein AmpE [Alteromonas mediterranea U4]AGP90766.1 regulatory protein AmpE [Alteromonas mediterranea U7]AGP94603.1 regulatory protein AmpE [Alteromonas mediterranea U8]|tara:strand:- start:1053 stop:1922 length:870 start_codon:yes stop_codon:yes gene_type:complete